MMNNAVTDTSFNPSGKSEIDDIKAAYAALEDAVLRLCPAGRRRNIALTELETSAMYAVKSVFDA